MRASGFASAKMDIMGFDEGLFWERVFGNLHGGERVRRACEGVFLSDAIPSDTCRAFPH